MDSVHTTLPARVAVVFAGGTLELMGRDRLDMAWYLESARRLSNEELLARLPELSHVAEIVEVPFRKLASHALRDRDLLDLAALVEHTLREDGVEGLVLTHGTNTLEETAYFLHLTLETTRPVVLVGAMRPASALSADGDLNLLNAVTAAASPAAAGKGVLVVLNDTIYSARDLTKTSTYRVHSFEARDLGPLGYTENDRRVVFYHQPVRPHTVDTEFDVRGLTELPRVDLVTSYVGADGTMIDAAVAAGARGIVSAGTGAGRPTPAEDEALDRARDRGVVVCITSRVGSGTVVRSPGRARRGFVTGDNLVPWKARMLLSLALTRTDDPERVQDMFDRY